MGNILRHIPDPAVVALFTLLAFAAVAISGWVTARLLGIKPVAARSLGALEAYKIVVTFTGIVLGFSLVQTQSNYRNTELAVSREAGTINQLDRVLLRYGPETNPVIRSVLHDYAVAVAQKDWPAMQEGREAPEVSATLARLNRAIQTLNDTTRATHPQLYAEMLRLLDALNDARQERIDHAQLGLSATLWEAIFGLLAILLILSSLIHMPSRIVAIGGHALALGILCSLVYIIDEPFNGETSVTADPIIRVITTIEARQD